MTTNLLKDALTKGVHLHLTVDGRLGYRSRQPLTDDLRAKLAQNKNELLAILQGDPATWQQFTPDTLAVALRVLGHRIEVVGETVRITPGLPRELLPLAKDRKQELRRFLLQEDGGLRGGCRFDLPGTDLGEAEDEEGGGEEQWPPRYEFPIDWQQEHRIERAALRRRLVHCTDREVRQMLKGLIARKAGSEEEWLRLGEEIMELESDLRRQGRLPDYDWPGAG